MYTAPLGYFVTGYETCERAVTDPYGGIEDLETYQRPVRVPFSGPVHIPVDDRLPDISELTFDDIFGK